MKLVLCFVLGLTLCVAASAMALTYTEQYEFNAAPDTVAGTAAGNVLYIADPTGNGTNGPSGFAIAGGIGTFLDDASSSGNQGYAVGNNTQAAWLQGSSNYTADFRVKVLVSTDDWHPNGYGKSMSYWSGNGRGLHFDVDQAYHVNGSGVSGSVGGWNMAEWNLGREIVNGATNTADFYVWNGSAYQLVASTTMGGSGWWGGSTVGFALGSTGGSSTQMCNYELDYFRVYSGGTGVDAVYELIPEPGSMLGLAAGLFGLAGFAIRRRRA